MEIKINSYIPMTDVEGVGTRFAIWVQGCSIHCKGCANSHMWDFNGGTSYPVEEVINLIKLYKKEIDGITWLGGEPLEQIEAVTQISKAVQDLGLSVILFTGYEFKNLIDKNEVQNLIKFGDILIDGKYDKDQQDFSRAWIGSKNQTYHFLTDRYNESVISKYKNKVEIRITPNNKVILTGMGDIRYLKKIVRETYV